jgi:hypothetical protein
VTEARCADASAAAGEPLAGTAVHVESWLLVEVRGTWRRDVSDYLADGAPGAAAISEWLASTPSSRLLFIRRPGTSASSRLVFVVRAGEGETDVRRIELDDLGDLDGVDLAAAGESIAAALVLVCGHGSRDACCAVRGTAVFSALAPHVPADELWISSHQAGHRFAANVLVLPQGIQLGRVAPDDAPRIVDDARRGAISLPHYRGRTAHAPRAQAAEVAVRAETGFAELDDLALVGDDGARVRLAARDGRTFTVLVEEVEGPTVPASCGATPAPQSIFSARLV